MAALDSNHAKQSLFYVWVAGFFALATFVAFTPTYFAPVAADKFEGPLILHLHGAFFFAWPVFFLLQAWLAATGRFGSHRGLGFAGVSLATAMVLTGIAAVSDNLISWIAKGHETGARAFAVITVTNIVLFASFVVGAIANTRRPEFHKRLMLMATLAIMPAVSGRLVFGLLNQVPFARPGTIAPPPAELVELAAIPHIAFDVLVLGAVIAYDMRTRGHPHPVYLIGGAVLIGTHALRVLLVDTPVWTFITDLLIALGR